MFNAKISYKLTRDVTRNECGWLERDFKAGEIVVQFTGYTYGCISSTGMAFNSEGITGFFELPRDAVEPYGVS